MPLPNYGYQNREKKEHQELKFQMAPEIVDISDDENSYSLGGGGAQGRKESRKRGQVTTGKYILLNKHHFRILKSFFNKTFQ